MNLVTSGRIILYSDEELLIARNIARVTCFISGERLHDMKLGIEFMM